MKTSLKILYLVSLLGTALGVASLTTGCAGTATSASTGEYIDDSVITTKVKAAFVNDPVVKALDVKVETFKGVVQLSGFVATEAEKSQAGRVAATINGVTNVKNDVIVR